MAVNPDLSACSAVWAVKAGGRCRCHSALRDLPARPLWRVLHSALLTAWARRFLRPLGAGGLKHERFHGFRTARCRAAGAPPVATVRRPVGAKNGGCRVVAAATTRIIHANGGGFRGKVPAQRGTLLVTPLPALTYTNRCPQVSNAPFPVAYSVSFDTVKSYAQRSMAIY